MGREKRPGYCKCRKTPRTSHQPRQLQETPIPLRQTHGFLGDSTGYCGYQHITCRNIILRFLCAHYNVNSPPTYKINAMVAYRYFSCVTHSSTATEVLQLHVIMKYVTRSSSSPENPSPLNTYAANPYSTWPPEDKRRRCITEGVFQKHG